MNPKPFPQKKGNQYQGEYRGNNIKKNGKNWENIEAPKGYNRNRSDSFLLPVKRKALYYRCPTGSSRRSNFDGVVKTLCRLRYTI